MGRLVGIELHNFKSYRGTTHIGFGTSCFTSIIGPNGAGKSNMIDAILFVLGIKSSQLRSSNMKDLIYRGRIEDSGLADASFDVIEQQNLRPTSAHVIAIYETDDGDKVEFKRSVSISGATDYKIDDKSVTASQYSAILKKENILIKAKNFLVFQGDVELIASQSPKDLTRLIETISGSIELAQEYDQNKEAVEKARDFTNSVFATKRNLNSESKQYREQLQEQEIFETKLTEKSDLIKIINLYKLYHNESKHDETAKALKAKNKELTQLKKNLSREENNYKDTIAEYSSESLDVSKLADEIAELQISSDAKKSQIIPLEANKKSWANKVNNHKIKIKELTSEINKRESTIKVIETQLRETKRNLKKFEDKIAIANSSNLPSEAHKQYEALRAEFLSKGGAELEERLSLLINERDMITDSIKLEQQEIDNRDDMITELQFIRETDLKAKLDSIDGEISEILATKESKIQQRNEMLKTREEFNQKELRLNSSLRDVLVKIDDLTSKQRESNKLKKQRETMSLLKNLVSKDSIRGFVYELIRPSARKYDNAVLALLGRNTDAIIVDTTVIAYKCIEILKERRLGVATFIPLDSIKSDPINLNYLRSLHPQAQPGVDIVEVEDKILEHAVNYVIGNTLVTDDISVARELKWGSKRVDNKLVTLQGFVINRSGLMTGGTNTERLQTVSWDKNQIKSLTDVKEDLSAELARINDQKPKEMELSLITDLIAELDDKLPSLKAQKEVIQRSMDDKQREIESANASIIQSEESFKQKSNELTKVEAKIVELNQDIASVQSSVYQQFCIDYDFLVIKDYEDLHGSSLRVKARERAQFNKLINNLTNKLNFETESLNETKQRKKSLESDIKTIETKMQEVVIEKESLENELDDIEARKEVITDTKAKSEEDLKGKLKFTKHIEQEIKEIKADISSLNGDITGTEETLLKVDTDRVNILKNCKIQNINIPLFEGLLENISLDDTAERLVKAIYEIEVDYDMLEDRLRESFTVKLEQELLAKVEMIMEELEKLTPNTKASQRLRDTELRLKEFDKDFTRARQNENKIIEKFEDVKTRRFDLFMKAFEHISDCIDPIYKELTHSPSAPMGGSAYLTLESDDEPYLSGIKYHAMPPLKRFRDMELLSGGEKTMAALALLFAIHSFQPSPFFVLDEIDAALDATNVNRIANYIKKNSSPTFQFIVISLKNALFEKSDALVGIYREQTENSSRTVSLDLRDYPHEAQPVA